MPRSETMQSILDGYGTRGPGLILRDAIVGVYTDGPNPSSKDEALKLCTLIDKLLQEETA